MAEALPKIDDNTVAFTHVPEHGFSLFLANRTKTLHFIRHGEGTHNEANRAFGDDTPVTFDTAGAWKYVDSRLTEKGIQQCVTARETLLDGVRPELVVVSPFTRTLQTAQIMFGGKGYPFIVNDLCRERWGKYTCDKRRSKSDIIADMAPLFESTNDEINFDDYAYATEDDEEWREFREPDESCTARAIKMIDWLATRPETEIAIVSHSSILKHLFRAFGQNVADKDKTILHRLAGNAEVRSICLAMHRGFYPEGKWVGNQFIPNDKSFRKGRWAPTSEMITNDHKDLLEQNKLTW